MKTLQPFLTILIGGLATVGALLQTPAQAPRQPAITALLPAGATLVLQAKDFSSLLSDWNGSAERAAWLESATYRSFSRSRLFLRLGQAQEEFGTAAGIPPGMALLADIAGRESGLALYDVGKLEFLYITRLPSAKLVDNALWRERGDYETRQAAGTPFYVRVDQESKRVVAFGTRDGYLVLSTREDLLAGSLALIGRQDGTSVESEGWFDRSVRSTGAAGDLRLVMNMAALVKEPHFRSYWVQDNVSEMRQYSSGVSDLFRTPTAIREERVLARAEERPAGAPGNNVSNVISVSDVPALGEVLRLVPDAAGLYRAWALPSAEEARTLVLKTIIAPSADSSVRNRTAPRLGQTGGATGDAGDLESTIDEEARAPRTTGYQTAALDRLLIGAPLTAMLHVASTRPGGDGVFVDRGAVVVLARSSDWQAGAARDAVRSLVQPMWTKAGLGLNWIDARVGTQSFSRMEGLDPLMVTERGRLLFVANDPALLASVLESLAKPAPTVAGGYAAGFRHSVERGRFASVMRFIDRAAATAENREPMFFSESLGSLSETLSRVDSASIIVRDAGATVSQTVTYQLGR
jgi:hypothetical protein